MAAAEEFQIPPVGEWSTRGGHYKIQDHQLSRKLEECRNEITTGRSGTLEEWFPILQQVVSSGRVQDPNMEVCWQILLEGVNVEANRVFRMDLSAQDKRTKMDCRNSIKMYSFLLVGVAMKYEGEVCAVPSKSRHGKVSSNVPMLSRWNEEKLKFVKMLLKIYDGDFCQLWEPPLVSMLEDFSALIAGLCYKLLENPSIARDKALLQPLAQILALAASKYGLMFSVALKLIQLLQHFEHLTNVLTMIVGVVVSQAGPSFVTTIVREIGSKDSGDLARDITGTKSLAAFLVSVSVAMATLVQPVINCLLPHLNGESVTFRNGVLGVVAEVLKQEGLTPDDRDSLLGRLTAHIHDCHAMVRVKALHLLHQLADLQSIPVLAISKVLDRVCGRLRDKSSLVRKAALQLLSTLLSKNPFSATFDKAMFLEKLADEKLVYQSLESEDEEAEEVVKSRTVISFLEAALNFCRAFEASVPLAVELLKSKLTSDVLEAMEFLRVCQLFHIEGADEGIGKCLSLVWSQDEHVRGGVVSTYNSIYFAATDCSSSKQHGHKVLNSLLELTAKATAGQKASLEKLVNELISASCLPEATVQELWKVYTSDNKEQQILAALILAMIVTSIRPSLASVLDRLMAAGLSTSSELLLATPTCTIITRLKPEHESCRLPSQHKMLERIVHLLKKHFISVDISQWMPFAEEAIQLVYTWAQHPDTICQLLVKDLAKLCFQHEGGVKSVLLSRLLHCVGHVAQWQLIHCECSIHNHRRGALTASKEAQPQSKQGEGDEELGLAAGGDDQEVDIIRKVMDVEVSGGDGFLLVFEPLLVSVVANPSKYPCQQLQTAAVLALAKFMLMSSGLCEKYLQLLFTVLEKSEVPAIRANLMVAASDLVCRFPNIIEPWTPFMYNRLRDDSAVVRKNSIMVLTHLILNDMVKVRGQICSMALCLKDSQPSIVEMANMFFCELSVKGNTLYNVVPDIISQLSDPSSGVSSATFKDVVSQLFRLIKKEKHQDSLVEKLCHRLRAIRDEQQAQNLAFCFSLVSPTEKGLQKLQENFNCYRDHLLDASVFKQILSYVNKAKKMLKNDVKELAEDFEKKANEYIQRGCDELEGITVDSENVESVHVIHH